MEWRRGGVSVLHHVFRFGTPSGGETSPSAGWSCRTPPPLSFSGPWPQSPMCPRRVIHFVVGVRLAASAVVLLRAHARCALHFSLPSDVEATSSKSAMSHNLAHFGPTRPSAVSPRRPQASGGGMGQRDTTTRALGALAIGVSVRAPLF